MQTITLEEHYATEAFMEGPGRELKAQAEAARSHPQVASGYEKLIEQLCGLGGGREPAIDEGKIALASKLMRDRETPVSAVCARRWASPGRRSTATWGPTAPRGLDSRGRIDSWKAR
jgi:hypothetical protein